MARTHADNLAWMRSKIKTARGRSVTLEQGTTSVSGLSAVFREFDYEVVDEGGFTTTFKSCDWIFVATDLSDFGTPPRLREGATVIEELNGREMRYEAMNMAARPCFEDDDSLAVGVVLHTKRVKK